MKISLVPAMRGKWNNADDNKSVFFVPGCYNDVTSTASGQSRQKTVW